MGFGKKTDFETGRTLDFDKTYKGIIKDAVTDAGLKCIGADEIKHSGLIDVPTCDFSLRAATCRLSLANKHITKLGRIVL